MFFADQSVGIQQIAIPAGFKLFDNNKDSFSDLDRGLDGCRRRL